MSLVVVVPSFSPSTQTARATQRNPLLKNKTNKQNPHKQNTKPGWMLWPLPVLLQHCSLQRLKLPVFHTSSCPVRSSSAPADHLRTPRSHVLHWFQGPRALRKLYGYAHVCSRRAYEAPCEEIWQGGLLCCWDDRGEDLELSFCVSSPLGTMGTLFLDLI